MEPIWSPSPERIARARLTHFMSFVRERHRAPVPDYAALHRWSIEFPENFWRALWDYCEIRAQTRATQILEDGNRMPGARDAGQPLQGEQGELVCSAPFPSVPIGFWGDTDGTRFRGTYFARYPNVWWHGDLATITPRGGLIVHGRSVKNLDALANPQALDYFKDLPELQA